MGHPMGSKRERTATFFLLASTVVVIHLVCWRATSLLRHHPNRAPISILDHGLDKRWIAEEDEPPDDIPTDPPSFIPYLEFYNGLSTGARPFALIGLFLWLVFLFSFLGITASDFFCPNLSTISGRLGLGENLAGVTFLAFGNGSPDVFSTFSSMKAHSGSLAIGELLGAASFIMAVVSGSMALIQPFQVEKESFLRDAFFFILAIIATLLVLRDGMLEAWEAATMVALYVFYVLTVAIGSWWKDRRDRRKERLATIRGEYAEEAVEVPFEPYLDEPGGPPTPPLNGKSPPLFSRNISDSPLLSPTDTRPPTPVSRSRARSVSSVSSAGVRERGQNARHMKRSPFSVRPSLLGAVEFRDVINSLASDSNARNLHIFHNQHEGSLQRSISDSAHPQFRNRNRAKSHIGAVRPVQSGSRPPSPPGVLHPNRRVRASSTGADGDDAHSAFEPSSYSARVWEDVFIRRSNSEEDDGGNLIDLSEGVDDPWKDTTPRRLSHGGSRALFTDPGSVAWPPFSPESGPSSERGLRIQTDSLEPPAEIHRHHSTSDVPSILVTNDAGVESSFVSPPPVNSSLLKESSRRWFGRHRRKKGVKIFGLILERLFPSVQEFSSKSLLGKTLAVFSLPAILLLNLTLPVVNDDAESDRDDYSTPDVPDEDSSEDPNTQREHEVQRALRNPVVPTRPPRLPMDDDVDGPFDADAVSEGIERFRKRQASGQLDDEEANEPPPGVIEQEINDHFISRWLAAIQCTLAPVFCVFALLGDELKIWYPFIAAGGGLLLGFGSYKLFTHRAHRGRIVLCFVGFVVAVVWILIIVGEVVGALQAVGEIFGISDAILGLTVFAMGNSLGDFVANVTIARMGYPVMAISACFGGPMLNILLGIGISGIYINARHGGDPYPLHLGRTLLVSGAGLLLILSGAVICVWWSDWWMTRKLGVGLIVAYCIILGLNVGLSVSS